MCVHVCFVTGRHFVEHPLMKGQAYTHRRPRCASTYVYIWYLERQKDRKTDRWIDKQTDRPIMYMETEVRLTHAARGTASYCISRRSIR